MTQRPEQFCQIVSPIEAGFTFDNQVISYITNDILSKSYKEAKRNRVFYLALHTSYIVFMALVIAAGSILAFFASSIDLDTSEGRNTVRGINITIAILGIVTETVQSLAAGFQIETRKHAFGQSKADIKRLSDKIRTKYITENSELIPMNVSAEDRIRLQSVANENVERLRLSALKGISNIKRRNGFHDLI